MLPNLCNLELHKFHQLHQLDQMRTDVDTPEASQNESVLLQVFRDRDLNETTFNAVFNKQENYKVDLPSEAAQKIQGLKGALLSLCKGNKEFESICQAQLVPRLKTAVKEVQEPLQALLEQAKTTFLQQNDQNGQNRQDCHPRNLSGWDVWDLAARRNGVPELRHLRQLVDRDAQPETDAKGLVRYVIPYAKDGTIYRLVLTNEAILQLLPHVWGMTTWLVRHMIVYPKVVQWDNDEPEFDARPTEAMYGPYEAWDVSDITDMNSLFKAKRRFNAPIGAWDVSNVRNMESMFRRARSFNQPIGAWNVGMVTTMDHMFAGAHAFNQPIGAWDVRIVTDMNGMFYDAESFNQPLGSHDANGQPTLTGGWDVGNVKYMTLMFARTTKFNQPIKNWNVSKVKNYQGSGITDDAQDFNQELPPFPN